jgi:hypothetical protein
MMKKGPKVAPFVNIRGIRGFNIGIRGQSDGFLLGARCSSNGLGQDARATMLLLILKTKV